MANEIMAKPIEKLTKKIHSDILCPFCMSELNRGEIIYKCPTCGKIVKQSAYEFATMKAPACYDPKCKKQIAKRYCKKCNNPLPFDILQYKKNLRFALIGIKGSGKTNYLTTMITEAKKTQSFPMILSWRENQTKLHYQANKRKLYEDRKRLDETTPGVRPTAQQWKLTARQGRAAREGTGNERSSDVYSLTIFDGAGEDCEHPDPVLSRYISGAHALIILFDPLILPSIVAEFSESVIGRSKDAEHYAEDHANMVVEIANYIRESCQINADDDIPKDVAIVFTKIDEVFSTFGFGTVRNPSPHLDAGGFVQKDADEVDREIRNWLIEREETEFLDAIEANFELSRVRFFGVSSYGEHPDNEGNPTVVEPLRVLDPLYWVLSLEGIIPVINNQTEQEKDEPLLED